MRRPPIRLQREWATKLRASGFEDLEAGGEKLSNRGTPTRTYVVDAADYYETAKARDVSHLSPLERRIWALHADRRSIRAIMAICGTKFNQTRDVINRARMKRSDRTKCRPGLKTLIRTSDTGMLLELISLSTAASCSKTS